jgi:adenylate kinase family enzyme
MRKVAVFGNAGGGKSTLARQLAEVTRLPLYPLDTIQFKPGGGEVPHAEYLKAHKELLSRDSVALVLAKIGSQLEKFEGWLPSELLRQAWPAQYRGAAALCEDWNDMREMFKLELPVKEEIVGLVGIAARQPQWSKMDASSKRTPMLSGGGEQVYFKRTRTLNSVNPLWVYPTQLW